MINKYFEDSLVKQALVHVEYYHTGQKSKEGLPYFVHCMEVAHTVFDKFKHLTHPPYSSHLDNIEFVTKLIIVALLHDVIEMTPEHSFEPFTPIAEVFATKYPSDVVEALIAITRKSTETYGQYIMRVKLNKLAREVKICDVKCNLEKCYRAGDKFESLKHRYINALKVLESEKSSLLS